jgi:hypothetical protein
VEEYNRLEELHEASLDDLDVAHNDLTKMVELASQQRQQAAADANHAAQEAAGAATLVESVSTMRFSFPSLLHSRQQAKVLEAAKVEVQLAKEAEQESIRAAVQAQQLLQSQHEAIVAALVQVIHLVLWG